MIPRMTKSPKIINDKNTKSKQKTFYYHVYGGNYPQKIEDALQKRGVWTKFDRRLQAAKSKER